MARPQLGAPPTRPLDSPRLRDALPAFTPRRLALEGRVSAPFDVVGLGDSLFSGQGVTGTARRWPFRAVEALRAALPTPNVRGGIGWVPARFAHTVTGGDQFVWQGYVAGADTGITRMAQAMGPDSGAGVGRATLSVRCTSVRFEFSRAGNDSFSIATDGGTPVQITAGPTGVWYWTSSQLTSGPHTFVIAQTGGVPQLNGGMVYDGDENSGIRYWDAARSGSEASQNTAQEGSAAWADSLGTLVTPDLFLVEWMTNDSASKTPTAYRTSLGNLRTLIRTKSAAPILWIAPWERTDGLVNAAGWAAYVDAMRGAAAADANSKFLNVADYVPRLSTQADRDGVLSDTLHPTDAFAGYVGQLTADWVRTVWAS